MKIISITYIENKGKPILHALNIIAEYTDMNIEEAAALLSHFKKGNDILYNVPAEKINIILSNLNSSGFKCNVL